MNLRGTIYIIGAGLAGLAAAVKFANAGRQVKLFEASPHAGGRCRSYHDPQLDIIIDNGNHLVMSGNYSVMAYLKTIGTLDRLVGPPTASYPFVDVRSGERWEIKPSKGKIPWWLLDKSARAPGTTIMDYKPALGLFKKNPTLIVADCLGTSGNVVEKFWEPLVVAAINEPMDRAAASLMASVMRETFMRGSEATRPMIARSSLADTFVEPAIHYIESNGGIVSTRSRISGFNFSGERITTINMPHQQIEVLPGDRVVLAVPAWSVNKLVPSIEPPPAGQSIINVHFKLPAAEQMSVTGLVGSTAQWLFVRERLASVTISAADHLLDETAEAIANACWRDIAAIVKMNIDTMPTYRLIKERRATFDQCPAFLHRRPNATTAYKNLWLAGDYTATGLPATIEGAIRSGFSAAERVLAV